MIADSNRAGLLLFLGLGFEGNGAVPGHRRLDRLIHRTRHAEPLEISIDADDISDEAADVAPKEAPDEAEESPATPPTRSDED